jgi:hypothetical protein
MVCYLILRSKNHQKSINITTVVFSYDRPFQLTSLLNSIKRFQKHSRTVIVIYRTSSKDFFESYQAVFERFHESLILQPYNENTIGFKKTMMSVVKNSKASHYLFYVDDQVVLSELYDEEISKGLKVADIFTYRLGLNTSYCYTLDKYQYIKNYLVHDDIITWRTTLENNDINYALSLDGTIIPNILINLMVKLLIYWGPNSFEGSMNYCKYITWVTRIKIGAPIHQKCVNFVLGRVQNEVLNKSGNYEIHHLHSLYKKNLELRANEGIIEKINSPHTESFYSIE